MKFQVSVYLKGGGELGGLCCLVVALVICNSSIHQWRWELDSDP